MPAMDQDALAEIKRLEAAGSFWAVETVRGSDAMLRPPDEVVELHVMLDN